MKKILFSILLVFITCGCAYNNSNIISKGTSPINSPETIKQTQGEYLSIKALAQEEFIKRLDKIDKKYQVESNRLWGVIAFVGVIIGICTAFGFKKYFSIDKQLTDTKNLFDIMAKNVYEKECELHEKFEGQLIGHKTKEEYTPLDEANYLDYEHKIYFAPLFLPITKDISKYKKSLFILASYWVDKKQYGRALLRLKEIEKIQEELDEKYVPVLTLFGLRRRFAERILGKDTARFFNLCGLAYHGCTRESKKGKDKEDFATNAEQYFKKAISLNPDYSSPYYNLGLLFSLTRGNNKVGIEWYKKAIAKKPNLTLHIYRNIACCQLRLNKAVKEIIATLKNIPDNDPYWQEIISDDVLGPKIKSTAELRRFVKTKYSNIDIS